MVKKLLHIFLFILCGLEIFAQKNNQTYIGRTLSDSAVQFTDLPYLNYKYIFGRYTNSYGAAQKLKLGSMFAVAGDSVTVSSSGGTGDVNQNGNSYGATMVIGTNDNNIFKIKTNNVERLSLSSGTSTGGLLTSNFVTSKTNTIEDWLKVNATSTGTVANGFGAGLWFTAPNASGTIKDMGFIRNSWTTALSGSEYSKIGLWCNAYGTASEMFYISPGSTGTGALSVDWSTPVSIDGSTMSTSQNYTLSSNYQWKTASSLANNLQAIYLSTTGSGSGTTINNGTFSATNPTANTTLTIDGSVSCFGAGTNNYTCLNLKNTLTQSGGHTGITRGILINPTLSGNYDFRALEISTTLGLGIYQTSTGIQNNLAGKTNIGSTGDPIVKLKVSGRFAASKGATITAAHNISLGTDGNSFGITGSTQINTIDATNWIAGSIIYLIFTSSVTLAHNTSGTGARIFLSGSINYAAVNNSVLGLIYDGSNWQEISRKTP